VEIKLGLMVELLVGLLFFFLKPFRQSLGLEVRACFFGFYCYCSKLIKIFRLKVNFFLFECFQLEYQMNVIQIVILLMLDHIGLCLEFDYIEELCLDWSQLLLI
jgi:hypothetical protein